MNKCIRLVNASNNICHRIIFLKITFTRPGVLIRLLKGTVSSHGACRKELHVILKCIFEITLELTTPLLVASFSECFISANIY